MRHIHELAFILDTECEHVLIDRGIIFFLSFFSCLVVRLEFKGEVKPKRRKKLGNKVIAWLAQLADTNSQPQHKKKNRKQRKRDKITFSPCKAQQHNNQPKQPTT